MESTQKSAINDQAPAVESRRNPWVRPTVKPVGELKELVQQQLSNPN